MEPIPSPSTADDAARPTPEGPPADVPSAGVPASASTAEKAALRTRLRRARRTRYGSQTGAVRRDEESRRLRPEILSLLSSRAGGTGAAVLQIALFHPTPLEPRVTDVLGDLRELGHTVLFPGAPRDGGTDLDWALWDGGLAFTASALRGFGDEAGGPSLGPGALAEVDLVLAPALAVDRSGTRLGHGAGYYDRALAHLRPGVPVIAVVHPRELLPAGTLPREHHDVPVDAALTADGLTALPAPGAAAHRPGDPGRP